MSEDMSDEDSVAEQFETVHDHLDYVDRTLDSITGEIETAIQDAFDESEIDITYDIDSGSFEGRLPLSEVSARVNRRLGSPFYVKIEDGKIVVNDIRREFDFDSIPSNSSTHSQRDLIKMVKQIISTVEEGHADGAPVDKVLSLLSYLGLSQDEAESEIENLRRKGEVYEPRTDHLRTT